MITNLENFKANPEKNLIIEIENKKYARLPIKTHIITQNDDIIDIVEKYAKPLLKNGDLLFISERIVAITQGRAFPIKDIKPRFLAKFLVKFVHKSPYGIGLGSPWTMELAIREAGVVKIIFASLISAATKLFGIKGVFYKIVGKNINAIDGPCDYTLPPYNEYAKLGPLNPGKIARDIKEKINHDAVIIDANDLGIAVLGKSDNNIDDKFCKDVFRDNPLGQSSEQTPLAIIRFYIGK